MADPPGFVVDRRDVDTVRAIRFSLPLLAFLAAAAPGVVAEARPGPPLDVLPDLERRYAERGVSGVFLLRALAHDYWPTTDASLVDDARIPASTFKVFSSLVALEVGAVDGVDEVVAWDGSSADSSAARRCTCSRTASTSPSPPTALRGSGSCAPCCPTSVCSRRLGE